MSEPRGSTVFSTDLPSNFWKISRLLGKIKGTVSLRFISLSFPSKKSSSETDMSLLAMNSLYNGKGKWPVPMVHCKKTLTPCAARIIIFRKENLNHLIVCFTKCTLFLQYVRFPFSICLPGVICGTYHVTRINAVSWHVARQTFWSRRLACLLRLFTFARISCLLQLWVKTQGARTLY